MGNKSPTRNGRTFLFLRSMTKSIFYCCACLIIFIVACQTSPANEGEKVVKNPPSNTAQELKAAAKTAERKKAQVDVNKIEGRWVANLLDVRMTSVKSIPDSTSYISAKGDDFGNVIGIEKMEYWFRKNGSYNVMYRNTDERIVRTFAGTWSTKNGVLILEETSPKVNTYYYEWTAPFEEDYQARMRGVLDYDYDGEEDDKVVMVLEKVSNQ